MNYANKLWLKKNFYFNKKILDYIFVAGQVVKIFYIARHKKKKRFYSFIGLCINKNNWNFKATNLNKRERIFFLFPILGPAVFKIFIIHMYKSFFRRVRRIFYRASLTLVDDLSAIINLVQSTEESIKHHLTDFFYCERWTFAKRKRYIKKYRYNTVWQQCYPYDVD